MTEKEYRKLISELEVSKEEKSKLEEKAMGIVDFLKTHIRLIEISSSQRAKDFAKRILIPNECRIPWLVECKKMFSKNELFDNQIVLNEFYQAFALFDDNIIKKSDIYIDENSNTICFKKDDYDIELTIVYKNTELFSYDNEMIRMSLVENANREYTAYRNTLQIIKWLMKKESIKINSLELEILLYYGLNEYFLQDNRYENYLNVFVRGIDDLFNKKIICLSSDFLNKLGLPMAKSCKDEYRLMDPVYPYDNLCSHISEVQKNEYKKLKKAISKLASPSKS
jgi:hypothetical protein